MCPRQATQIAGMAVMSGMARREDGIGPAWWELGLKDLRYADAADAVRWLVAGGIGDRSWITARDVIRRVRAIRADRHARAPDPVPPADLMPADGDEDTAELYEARKAFRRWYYTAVGNGEQPGRALELAVGAVGLDRYIEAGPVDTGGPVDPDAVERVRGVIEQDKKRKGHRG